MIDQALKDIIINRIGIIIDEQSNKLMKENDRLGADAASRGFPSKPGDTQAQIKELYERHYSDLPRLIIQGMRDVLLKSKPKPSPELSKYLKDIVSSHSINLNNFRDTLRFQNIDSAIAETVIISPPSRFFPEIDLIIKELENLKKGDRMGSESNITTLHINAPGVIVQTGDHSTAKLITINQTNMDDIIKALDSLRIEINNVADVQGYSKGEVINLIEESKIELSKAQPNSTRLKSFLSDIALVIQTSASLKPAYDVLKTVLLPIGITLP
jgi:hypothetical protein